MQSRFIQIDEDNIGTFSELYATVFNASPWNDGWSATAVAERFASFSKYPTFFGIGHIGDGVPNGLAFGWSALLVTTPATCIDRVHLDQPLGQVHAHAHDLAAFTLRLNSCNVNHSNRSGERSSPTGPGQRGPRSGPSGP